MKLPNAEQAVVEREEESDRSIVGIAPLACAAHNSCPCRALPIEEVSRLGGVQTLWHRALHEQARHD